MIGPFLKLCHIAQIGHVGVMVGENRRREFLYIGHERRSPTKGVPGATRRLDPRTNRSKNHKMFPLRSRAEVTPNLLLRPRLEARDHFPGLQLARRLRAALGHALRPLRVPDDFLDRHIFEKPALAIPVMIFRHYDQSSAARFAAKLGPTFDRRSRFFAMSFYLYLNASIDYPPGPE